ncbi:MAG: DsbA family oxidoreductase [Candidatus Methanomethylophilaceae archaeon]|nr:DsbA family oxidoreductase [Candidatus Methanomethylophilaceae archaeon]
MQKIGITYWSDFSCPYCYIGIARLKKALAQEGLEAEIEMKAFRLDPSAGRKAASNTVTRFARKYCLTEEEAAMQVDSISRLGRGEGLDFRYSSTLFTNTMDAHRLEKHAQKLGKGERMAEILYEMYFCRNLELADRDVLLRAAEECGLERREAERVIDSSEYEKEVLEDEKEARSAGIFAVPYFIINGRIPISGAADRDSFRRALNASLGYSDGNACGPEGCRI